MKFAFPTLWLLLAAFLLVPTVRCSAQPLPERHWLRGRVVRSDGKPVAGAQIALHRTDFQEGEGATHSFNGGTVSTDDHGDFSFDDAEVGSYYLMVEADGYAQSNQNIDLDMDSRPITITVYRLTTLKLRFLKPDGGVLGNAFLTAYLRGPGLERLPPLRTNEAGETGISSLVPAQYALQAVCSGVGAALVDKIVLHEDSNDTVEVKLRPGGSLRVAARENSSANPGKPLGGAIVTFQRLEPQTEVADPAQGVHMGGDTLLYEWHLDRANLVSHEGTGRVDISDLLPGRYKVGCFLPDCDPPAAQIVDIAAGATTNANFDFKPRQRLSSLEITVQDAGHHPLADSEFWLQTRPVGGPEGDGLAPPADLPPPPPDVPPEVSFQFPGGAPRRATTDNTGKLTVYPLHPGKWHVTVMMPRNPAAESRPAIIGAGEATVDAHGGQLTITSTPAR